MFVCVFVLCICVSACLCVCVSWCDCEEGDAPSDRPCELDEGLMLPGKMEDPGWRRGG